MKEDPSLVEDFDNDYWGWDEADLAQHKLYQRPEDPTNAMRPEWGEYEDVKYGVLTSQRMLF